VNGGLEPSELDVSELDQEVRGYMVPRPKLQQAYLFDVVESDWMLAFKRERGPDHLSPRPGGARARQPATPEAAQRMGTHAGQE
jgi:hypothetical protein